VLLFSLSSQFLPKLPAALTSISLEVPCPKFFFLVISDGPFSFFFQLLLPLSAAFGRNGHRRYFLSLRQPFSFLFTFLLTTSSSPFFEEAQDERGVDASLAIPINRRRLMRWPLFAIPPMFPHYSALQIS